jgi:hypothetical protein
MTFNSHPVVKDYTQELAKITKTREELRNRMVDLYEQSYKTQDDDERRALVMAAKDVERQVSALTAKGSHYMLKIDQLNGVR